MALPAVITTVCGSVSKVFGLLLSPWVIVGVVAQYAIYIHSIKKMAKLIYQITARGFSEESRCTLCTNIMERIVDESGAKDIAEAECEEICPFKLNLCMKICEGIKMNAGENVEFPCAKISMCPKFDQFGEKLPTCEFKWKQRKCFPKDVCQRKLPFGCEINPGYAKWRYAKSLVTVKANALVNAVKDLPKCSDPNADPDFCVAEAEGFDLLCDYLSWAVVFFLAPLHSVNAISTPGGGDDRQWLSFWVIFFIFSGLERFTIVTLSRTKFYYLVKLILIVWLSYLHGADQMYVHIQYFYNVINRLLKRDERVQRIFAIIGLSRFFTEGDKTEEDCMKEFDDVLEKSCLTKIVDDAKKSGGIQKLYEQFTSKKYILERYGECVLNNLMDMWSEKEFHFIEIDLISASDIPVMDESFWGGTAGSCDPYAIFYLVPPKPKSHKKRKKPPPRTSLNLLFTRLFRQTSGLVTHLKRQTSRLSTTSFSMNGPMGLPGQYGRTKSKVVPSSLSPVWNQMLEIKLEGDYIDIHGNSINEDAPFTELRVELWDRDRFQCDDFIGEFTIPLCPLMTGMKYHVEKELEDPEGLSEANILTGKVKLCLKYAI